jgi:acetyl esterase/lipase
MKPIEQVRAMLAGLIGGPDTSYRERRAQSAEFAQAFLMPGGLRIAADELGGVPVEWVIPNGAPLAPSLLHLHGGGYVLGDPPVSRPLTTAFALRAGVRVASVDYRLAPEHPFPAAVEDSLKVYRALLARGHAATELAIGGESAGGGLAIATLLAARDAGVAMPASAFAISPWTDMACSADSFDTRASVDPLLTRRALKEMGDAYLAGSDPRDPLASPHYANLAGLPPLLIHVGGDEVLLDDATTLHQHAVAAGVDSTLEVWDGMIHVWHMFHPMLPEGAEAIARVVRFVKSHWR